MGRSNEWGTTVSETPVEMVALNADVVGYSRLLADDLEATTATMEEYKDLVEEKVAESGGTLVNFVGDNFMAVFDDAKDALRTSIAIAIEIESKNATRSGVGQTRFRMGMDQGVVTISDGRYFRRCPEHRRTDSGDSPSRGAQRVRAGLPSIG